jgi:hypothetical protein
MPSLLPDEAFIVKPVVHMEYQKRMVSLMSTVLTQKITTGNRKPFKKVKCV